MLFLNNVKIKLFHCHVLLKKECYKDYPKTRYIFIFYINILCILWCGRDMDTIIFLVYCSVAVIWIK